MHWGCCCCSVADAMLLHCYLRQPCLLCICDSESFTEGPLWRWIRSERETLREGPQGCPISMASFLQAHSTTITLRKSLQLTNCNPPADFHISMCLYTVPQSHHWTPPGLMVLHGSPHIPFPISSHTCRTVSKCWRDQRALSDTWRVSSCPEHTFVTI